MTDMTAVVTGVTAEQSNSDTVTLSTGVVLRAQPISRFLLKDALSQYELQHPTPKVPVVTVEDKGREEENPSDPTYLEALRSHEDGLINFLLDMLILWGTQLVFCPDAIEPAESPNWAELIQITTGITIERHPLVRYMQWVKYIAAPQSEDLNALGALLRPQLGVPESEVQAQLDSFPDHEART